MVKVKVMVTMKVKVIVIMKVKVMVMEVEMLLLVQVRKYLDTVVLGAATHNDVGSGPRIITDSIFLIFLFIEILSTSLSFLYDP